MLKILLTFALLCSLAYSSPPSSFTGCDSPNDFKYPNGSCLPTCLFPYQVNWEYDTFFCDNPCPDSYFNIWKETCVESCDPEFILSEDDILYCDHPGNNTNGCPENAEFMYYNGTCLPSCQHPFKSQWSNGSLLCVPNCGYYSYFNFWTERCISSCDPGFRRVENKISYCDQPPQSNNTNGCPFLMDVIHPNGSCLTECPEPLKTLIKKAPTFYTFHCISPCTGRYYDTWNRSCTGICKPEYARNESGILYCDNPQPIETKPCPYYRDFRYPNGSCLSSCTYPFKIRGKDFNHFCDAPCPSSYLNPWDGNCMMYCDNEFIRSEDGITYCDQPNNTSNGCPDSDDFRYLNGSCLPSCQYPFKNKQSYGSLLCVPSCQYSYFNFWTERCISSCDNEYLRAENGLTYCDQPPKNLANGCPFDSDFKHPDGSCFGGCSSPLIPEEKERALYCNLPCPAEKYYNPYKRNCSDTCRPDLIKTQSGVLLCYESPYYTGPCPSQDWLIYPDGSCKLSCPSPYYSSPESGNFYCKSPCPAGQYIYFNGSCIEACNLEGFTTSVENGMVHCRETKTDGDEGNSTKIKIYLRYDIPLKNFNAGGYLAKFITMMTKLLDVSSSDIKIISLKEGSTIIESEVVLETKSKANLINQKLIEAAESKTLDLEGISVLNHKFSVVIPESGTENDDVDGGDKSSSRGLVIGLGVGLAVVAVGIITLVVYSRYQKKQKLLKVRKQVQDKAKVASEEKRIDEEIRSFVHRETVQPEADQLSPRIKIEPEQKEEQVEKEGPLSMDEIMKNIDENL